MEGRGTKRKRAGGVEHGHNQGPPQRHHRSKAPNSNSYKNHSNSQASSINALKKKTRDLKRLLDHSNKTTSDSGGADARQENERALAAYQHDLDSLLSERAKSKMIKRYHMVRFFERQKASRRLKKLVRDKAKEEERHEAQVDLNYTLYAPLYQKYASLYKGEAETEQKSEKDKPEAWYEVERRMSLPDPDAQRELEALRNSGLENEDTNLATKKIHSKDDVKKKGRKQKDTGSKKGQEHDTTHKSDVDSDFFE